MAEAKQNPPQKNLPLLFTLRSLGLYLTGRVRYLKPKKGKYLIREDGTEFEIFREIVICDRGIDSDPGGVFRVWFYANTPFKVTRVYSVIATIFYLGMPGFRQKLYLVNHETGELGGIYTFDTLADAEGYADSFAMKLSEKRSLPGKFRLEAFDPGDMRTAMGREILFKGKNHDR